MARERILRMAEESKTKYIYPETVVPEEFDRLWLLEGKLRCEAHQTAAFLAVQPVKITDDMRLVGLLTFRGCVRGELFRRDGYAHYHEINRNFYKKPLENLVIKDHQHANAKFADVLTLGLNGLMKKIQNSQKAHAREPEKLEYLQALEIVLQGILTWEDRCAEACAAAAAEAANEARAAELREMAEILRNVPRNPAKSFREAVQALYFAWQFVPDSLGTPDRYLLQYYRNDVANGVITREEAKELLQELFVTVNGWTNPANKWASDKGGESHFCIGGYDANGNDGYNELSQLILEGLMEIPTYRPQISFRWTEKTPRDVLHYVMDCERKDAYKRVALVGDPRRIQAMTQMLGIPYEDAITYTMCGCNEPAIQGGINEANGNFNGVRCLDRLLYECRDEVLECRNFEEFYELFEREFAEDVDRYVEISDGFSRYLKEDVDLISSLFMDGPIEKGISVIAGGARYGFGGVSLIGTGTVIDSLVVLKQFVFDQPLSEREEAMREFLDMLDANWEGYDREHWKIHRTAKYHGNNDAEGDAMAQRYTTTVHKLFAPKRNLFGFPYLIGDLIGYCTHNVYFGSAMRATPDGRFAGDPISFGAGQTGGRDREGLAALLNSVAKMDPTNVMTGPTVLNVTLDETLIRDDEKFEKTVDLVETYFRQGGSHIQLNYVSAEELRAAQANPGKYESLRVRVSGFSGYFTLLDPALQADVIARTVKSQA